jgi:iron complex transport system substrate-binding protein
MIEEAGGRQAYQATQGFANQPWPQVSKETVLAVAPDVLIFSVGQTDADTSESTANCLAQLRKDAAWAQVPAVKEGRVYVMDEDLITIPGPRLVEGLEQMAEFLHPSSATEPQ